jgi:hypothetical protein
LSSPDSSQAKRLGLRECGVEQRGLVDGGSAAVEVALGRLRAAADGLRDLPWQGARLVLGAAPRYRVLQDGAFRIPLTFSLDPARNAEPRTIAAPRKE